MIKRKCYTQYVQCTGILSLKTGSRLKILEKIKEFIAYCYAVSKYSAIAHLKHLTLLIEEVCGHRTT